MKRYLFLMGMVVVTTIPSVFFLYLYKDRLQQHINIEKANEVDLLRTLHYQNSNDPQKVWKTVAVQHHTKDKAPYFLAAKSLR